MKKSTVALAIALCVTMMSQAKKIETAGYDLYKNDFKIDLVSLGYVAPQISWEHFTGSRVSLGVDIQTHFMNRSTLRDTKRSFQKQVNDSVKLDTKYDRRFAGVMIAPEFRLYMGKKPNRGFYGGIRLDAGIFQESFDISERYETRTWYFLTHDTHLETTDWKFLRNEKVEINYGLGAGMGIGYQAYFGKNSHWGFDINGYFKYDWRIASDQNRWEWDLGPGLLLDLDASIVYRF